MLQSDILHLARMFHQACRLPTAVYDRGHCEMALPGKVLCAAEVLEGEMALSSLSPSPGQVMTAQFLMNRYKEHFIYFDLDAGASLLCGPFALKQPTDGEILRRIRALHLPLGKREEIAAHWRAMTLLTEDNYFYTGKLLERLFSGSTPIPGPSPVLLPDMSKNYFEQTYENRMAQFQHPPFFLEQEEVRLISHGDRENAVKVLAEINRLKRATLAKDPLRSLKNSLICSCTLFTRAAIAGGVPADEAFTLSDTFIQTIENAAELKSLEALEEAMMLRFIDQVNEKTAASLSGVVRSAIAYIDRHLSEKLTVPMIAGHVYIHPDYLSSRFKQETGTSITAFVKKRRIEEACQFLRYSRSTVSEIAAFYQFCSQSHFIAVFKKHMGMTPAQYKSAV